MEFQSEMDLVGAMTSKVVAAPQETAEEKDNQMNEEQCVKKCGNKSFNSTMLIGVLMVTLVGSAVGGSTPKSHCVSV